MLGDIDMEKVKKRVVREIIQEGDKRLAKMLSHSDLELRPWYDTNGEVHKQGLLTCYDDSSVEYLLDNVEYINSLMNEALRNYGISSTHTELQGNPHMVVDLDLWKNANPSYFYSNM